MRSAPTKSTMTCSCTSVRPRSEAGTGPRTVSTFDARASRARRGRGSAARNPRRSTGEDYTRRLFVAEGLHGIDRGGAAGGDRSGGDGGARDEQGSGRDRGAVYRPHPEELALHEPAQAPGRGDRDRESGEDHGRRVPHDEPQGPG